MVKKNSIPERWRSLRSVGLRLPGSRFIAFKVPLKGTTNQRVTQNQKFTPKDLVNTIRAQNDELGMVIDLTNTERYYTTKDFPKSVQYVKLHTAGLKIPDDATIHHFKRVVRRFLFANADNEKLIGVHCTTGINRTGYLICRYLIDVDGWRPLYTISVFAQSRGHPIEGAVYIEDLLKGSPRSNVGIDLPPTEEEMKEFSSGPDVAAKEKAAKAAKEPKDRLRSILEQLPGNDLGDFDARDQGSLPLMQAGDFPDDRDFFNPREGRFPPQEMMDERGARMPFDYDRRFPDDFPGDCRLIPAMETRRGMEPRPLMDIREAYGPREMQRLHDGGMPLDDMDHDFRTRPGQIVPGGFLPRQYPPEMQYDKPTSRPAAPLARVKMSNPQYDATETETTMQPMSYQAKFRQLEGHKIENKDSRFDPREQEMIPDSFRRPMNERMQPGNAQLMNEPMNERMHPRGMESLMNERMHARETPYMQGSMGERMHPREAPFMEGPMNERMQSRDASYMGGVMTNPMNARAGRGIKSLMTERMQPRNAQFMEGPANERMHPRESQDMEGSVNERMQPPKVARLMDIPLNERMNPRDGRAVDGPANERMPTRAAEYPMNQRMAPRGMQGPMNERIPPRVMEGNMSERMPARDGQGMEGTMNERMYPRVARSMAGAMNQHMYPTEARGMQGPTNQRMYPTDSRGTEGTMNESMPSKDMQPMDGTMAQFMQARPARSIVGPVSEHMHAQDGNFPMNKPRPMAATMRGDFSNGARPFEVRKVNPAAAPVRGPSRFAPYPPGAKPMQPAGMVRGQLRPAGPTVTYGMPMQAASFPPRNRFT